MSKDYHEMTWEELEVIAKERGTTIPFCDYLREQEEREGEENDLSKM